MNSLTDRRSHLKRVAAGLVAPSLIPLGCSSERVDEGPSAAQVGYEIKLDTIRKGFIQDFVDRKHCWVHARAGAIPNNPPAVVLTMQKLLLSGSDIFYALNEMRTDDLGATWSPPLEHETLGRRQEAGGVVAALSDVTPQWHAKTGKLLAIGHTARYRGDILAQGVSRQTAYSVYDAASRSWSSWERVDMPDEQTFFNAGAGSLQRWDLPNGEILLPLYFKGKDEPYYKVTVTRCSFDGKSLRYLEHGDVQRRDYARGLAEPSLTFFRDRYYLTLRHDMNGYVTRGSDGLHFEDLKPWTWDDGRDLGNYNTQQHWVAHSDALFLAYTRRGAHNDHVFRHRAPLFIAEVDPEKLHVIRKTERVLVPERGARLGNFGVVHVNPQETWVTVTELMQPVGCEKYGSDNSVYVARIAWDRPNKLGEAL